MWRYILIILMIITIGLTGVLYYDYHSNPLPSSYQNNEEALYRKAHVSPTPVSLLLSLENRKVLDNGGYHIFQSFNNCGPAALSMALSYYDVSVSQETLGNKLRPYQNPQGINDDKSVTLEELAEESRVHGFTPYHRPMGDVELLQQFIQLDMPVVARTWLEADEDIGHYRVVKGFDRTRGVLIQDDSLQGKDIEYSYSDFNEIWEKFNYEYLVLVPEEKREMANTILGEYVDESIAWEKTVDIAKKRFSENPDDIYAQFNLSVALYKIGRYQESVEHYEGIAERLPFRTLWYQIEPVLAYYEIGDFDTVFNITDGILNNQNRAFSELYVLRGRIYASQGNIQAARQEYQQAVFYNQNLEEAQSALNSL